MRSLRLPSPQLRLLRLHAAALSTQQASTSTRPLRVGVVGAGVIGLASAKLLLQSGCEVSVVADSFPPNTTSDGAAAFWERRCDSHSRLARLTLEHYHELQRTGEAAAAGVGEVSGASYSHDSPADAYVGFAEDVRAFRRGSDAETAAASSALGTGFKSSLFWTSVCVDSPSYLRWLLRSVAAAGGRLAQLELTSLQELSPFFDLIVNASGLGARQLAQDDACRPIRGQVLRVHAPHVDSFSTATSHAGADWHSTYILPRPTSGVVTLGGTYEVGREDTGCDEEQRDAIWRRCCALDPRLLDSRTRVLHSWVGLRPGRTGDVRIELEEAAPGGASVPVVHCYGHAGCGHSLHHGTALDVGGLVSSLRDRPRRAALPLFAAPELSR